MENSAFDTMPLVLTVSEAAKLLRIGLNSTYDLVRCGAIRSLRIGRQLRIPRQAILDYLEQQS